RHERGDVAETAARAQRLDDEEDAEGPQEWDGNLPYDRQALVADQRDERREDDKAERACPHRQKRQAGADDRSEEGRDDADEPDGKDPDEDRDQRRTLRAVDDA